MDSSRIRVLITAFATVPGSSPHAAALMAMIASVRAEIDMVTVKSETTSHHERIGEARMFRVPVGEQGPLEQRVTFDRAVGRQLEAERYDVVHVRGPFEGALAAERKSTYGFQLVYEMATFPDEALGAEVEKRWAEAHEKCLDRADLVLGRRRPAGRATSGGRGNWQRRSATWADGRVSISSTARCRTANTTNGVGATDSTTCCGSWSRREAAF